MEQLSGKYRFQEEEKLANGRAQLEVTYTVPGASMILGPVGTIFEMEKRKININEFEFAGSVIESQVLAIVLDESGNQLLSRPFFPGDEIYFTTKSFNGLCADSTSEFCKGVQPEDESPDTAEIVEGEDIMSDTSVDKKDPGGCTCMVVRADGTMEEIPLAMGLLALGMGLLMRRRKNSK